MSDVGAIDFGGSPFGCGDEPVVADAAATAADAVTCAERRTRKLLGALPDIFNTEYDESLQSDVLYAIADTLCRYQAERTKMVSDTRVASATAVALERVGEGYGVGRQGLALTDDQYRELIKALLAKPRGTRAAIVRVVRLLYGVTPTITVVAPFHIRVSIPTGSLQEGFDLGMYPSENVTDGDTGRGRGYAAQDLSIDDSTGETYIFGSAFGDAEQAILERVVVAGVTVDLVAA